MKLLFNSLLNLIRGLLVLGILLFSIATFMGKSYLQTFILLMMAAALLYWPDYLKKRWIKSVALAIRALFIIILFIINVVFFKPAPKTSIYLSEANKNELLSIYDQQMKNWPDDTEDIYIQSKYGKVHVLACGLKENPPLMMVHAASMGAHSWAENLEPLMGYYRIYSIDNIGEGNKSELENAMIYPKNGKEIADFYAYLADALGIKCSPVFGASNGGFIALNYAYYYPDRVSSLALFGPMGVTQLTGNSIMMLSIATMYPFQFIRDYVMEWALGDNPYVIDAYGNWFNSILKGTIPSFALPVPMTSEQKQAMDLPILLFLGTKDPIVGDAGFAEETAKEFPNIKIEVLDSSHIIAVEKYQDVNKTLKSFLQLN